jgi:hypothetical protein
MTSARMRNIKTEKCIKKDQTTKSTSELLIRERSQAPSLTMKTGAMIIRREDATHSLCLNKGCTYSEAHFPLSSYCSDKRPTKSKTSNASMNN